MKTIFNCTIIFVGLEPNPNPIPDDEPWYDDHHTIGRG